MRAPKVKREELVERLDWVEQNRPKQALEQELLRVFGFTAQEASFALRVSPRTISRAVAKGALKPTAFLGLPPKATPVFSRASLVELVKG